MGLHHADHHIDARLALGMGALQHLEGLADPGRGADKDLQPSSRALLAPCCLQQGFGRGTLMGVAALMCHEAIYSLRRVVGLAGYLEAAASSARLSARTLTRGSPRRPIRRPSVCAPTSARTRSSAMARAFATRADWNSAASGEMSGSSPLLDVVTRSIGTGIDGFSAFSFSTSSLIRSASALLVGPRLEPIELAAL